jgi:hypothetical protein
MKLRELAHARSGDKGNVSNISVIAYEPGDYAFLAEHVTAERVKAHFADIVGGPVERYELPGIGALNFVMHAGRRRDALALARRSRQVSELLAARSGTPRPAATAYRS